MTDRLSAWLRIALIGLAALLAPTVAHADSSAVQTTWRLLDYIAVDYPGAVAAGKVISDVEYQEMQEFSASVAERLAALPPGPAHAGLVAGADALKAAVEAKAAPAEIERLARGLGARLIAAYPVPLAPQAMPDLGRGAALYAENCASCHGGKGDANAPLAASMDPPPIAFTNGERARERSVFALYQVIEQGLEGTAMQSYAHLPEADRWALAFHVGRFAYPESLAAEGKRIWEGDAALRARIPDMAALTAITPRALAEQIGQDRAAAVIAYLRASPAAVVASSPQSLELARERLQASLAAYRAGDRRAAEELALSAYLDGFEPVEPILSARDAELMRRVERAMAELRAAIGRGRPAAEVQARVESLGALFDETEAAIAPDSASAASTFVGAFAILLREGLEALLIVVAMLAFLKKADRPQLVRHVHAGWGAALVAGVATWWAAAHMITVSGADRELVEGYGALLAAAVLLFVGIWMHGKAQAGEWQRYIRDKLDRALSRRSAWFLFALAFIAVYREVFETIIFYVALATQGQAGAMAAGAAAATALLALIAWAMLRYSRKLPVATFFRYSSALIAVLAVVLAGKGVSALQEAGLIGVTPLAGLPTIDILGVTPTVQTIAAQVLTALILVAGFTRNRVGRPAEPVEPRASEA